jgi:hypothetical protein
MAYSRKAKLSLTIAVIAAVAGLGSAAIEGAFSTGNGTSINQSGNNDNACANNSHCTVNK